MPSQATDSRFLNVGQAARYLGVSSASLRQWSDQGRVPVYRTPGGQRRFRPEDLDQFLHSMRAPSPTAARANGAGSGRRAV